MVWETAGSRYAISVWQSGKLPGQGNSPYLRTVIVTAPAVRLPGLLIQSLAPPPFLTSISAPGRRPDPVYVVVTILRRAASCF